MGIPLPGEITLVSASLLAATGVTNVWGVAIAASIGAIVGDSIGYAIGRRGGRPLLERFGRRFPKHFGPPTWPGPSEIFERWGVWAVFFGRFVALLRILAGPLAGALHVPYRKFLHRQRGRRHRLGVRHRLRRSTTLGAGGREVPQGLLLDRPGRWRSCSASAPPLYLRRRAARAHVLLDDDDPTTEPSPIERSPPSRSTQCTTESGRRWTPRRRRRRRSGPERTRPDVVPAAASPPTPSPESPPPLGLGIPGGCGEGGLVGAWRGGQLDREGRTAPVVVGGHDRARRARARSRSAMARPSPAPAPLRAGSAR